VEVNPGVLKYGSVVMRVLIRENQRTTLAGILSRASKSERWVIKYSEPGYAAMRRPDQLESRQRDM